MGHHLLLLTKMTPTDKVNYSLRSDSTVCTELKKSRNKSMVKIYFQEEMSEIFLLFYWPKDRKETERIYIICCLGPRPLNTVSFKCVKLNCRVPCRINYSQGAGYTGIHQGRWLIGNQQNVTCNLIYYSTFKLSEFLVSRLITKCKRSGTLRGIEILLQSL